MEHFIPLSVPNLIGNELKYVTDAISSQWVSTGGSYITEFENRFAAYAKTEKAVACQSGTAALHLSLLVYGIGVGDLVIAPTLTFIAAVNPIRYVGAEPVFMDCDDSLCMDMDKLEEYLSEECRFEESVLFDKSLNKPVKAIVVVHVFGNCANMEKLIPLAEKYGLVVIEDATEAVGTFYTSGKYTGKMLGTIGNIGAYSFNGNKIITTSGGGMLVSRDPVKLARAKHLSTQAKVDEINFIHDQIGYNYRMTNLQAAMGVAQLEQLDTFISIKKENYMHYINQGIPLLPFSERIKPNYWFYSHKTHDRDGLIKRLVENGIQSRPIWTLLHCLPMYSSFKAYKIKNADYFHNKVVNLPCSSNLTKAQVEIVAKKVLA